MVEQVPVIVYRDVYPPSTLLIPCEPDPKLPANTITEDVVRQSLERKARLDRCRATVEAIIEWGKRQ